jgi:hypothetical protein
MLRRNLSGFVQRRGAVMSFWNPNGPASGGRLPSPKLGSVLARAGVGATYGSPEWRRQAKQAVRNAGLTWFDEQELIDEVEALSDY